MKAVWLWLCFNLLCLSLEIRAAEDEWKTSWDAVLYAYPEILALTHDSVLNPNNSLTNLAEFSATGEARLNLHLETERFSLALRPILSINQADSGAETHQQDYLSQWQARVAVTEHWAASVGRELMNWGPAQFRSPSSPFYFDNGRSNPLLELSGMDTAQLVWTPDLNHSLNFAYIQDSGHLAGKPDYWRDTLLVKDELRGDDWAIGLALAKQLRRSLFVGAYAQQTISDAWLAYGEIASATRTDALLSPADNSQPFSIMAQSPRQETGLIGATRTLENGQSLTFEYLYDGHGYTDAESSAYFARAASSLSAAALALSYAPPLLNRHYANFIWQNNILDGEYYWRLMLSRNLDDGSFNLIGYTEYSLSSRLSLFAMGVYNTGGSNREFAALTEYSLTLGSRLALP